MVLAAYQKSAMALRPSFAPALASHHLPSRHPQHEHLVEYLTSISEIFHLWSQYTSTMATLTEERIEPYEVISCVPHSKPVLVSQYVITVSKAILRER